MVTLNINHIRSWASKEDEAARLDTCRIPADCIDSNDVHFKGAK